MLVPLLSLKLVAGLYKAAESAVVLLVCVWLWWCLVLGVVFGVSGAATGACMAMVVFDYGECS